MTPEQLMASIIHLALQGKLVEQRPEEGSAKVLFQQIQEEKARLIQLKILKPEKSIQKPEEYPYDIPESWVWARITDCGSFISGYTPKPTELKPEGTIPYFKVSDMNTKGNEVYLSITDSYLKDDNSKKYFLKNTIVYPKNGGAVFTNKKRILAQNSVVDLNTGGYSVIGNVSLKYFYIYFSQIDFRQCYKGTALPTIDMDKLKRRWIPLPPLEEQYRIVAKIEELMPYIDRYAESYEKLEQFNAKFPEDMKKSILQYAIQGKLVEQRPEEGTAEELYQQIQEERQISGVKDNKKLLAISEGDYLFDIPETWKWVRIGEIFQTSSGTTPLKTNNEYYNSEDYSWIRTTDLNNGVLTQGEIKISRKAKEECNLEVLPYNSVCIAMYGGGGTIGKNALIQFDTTINQSVCAIHPNNFCDMKYLLYYMQFFRPFWMLYAAGSRKDPNINQIIINNAVFPLPPLEEQHRIVAKIEELMPYCDKLKE